ncbi:hypothetical protein PoB_002228000 [Plakobranchus ocellatus]|uniref:Uncharacterized protein n=1 Tax=Plakobranchus ocellatus TaxID=259542 RepID=A0AAV3ZKV0_9GAST|nr:hypothetical protein PoB_002228000 [Plakobranchus ocellatus]
MHRERRRNPPSRNEDRGIWRESVKAGAERGGRQKKEQGADRRERRRQTASLHISPSPGFSAFISRLQCLHLQASVPSFLGVSASISRLQCLHLQASVPPSPGFSASIFRFQCLHLQTSVPRSPVFSANISSF